MKLLYDESGNGAPVLLIHGLGGTGNVWGGIVPSLARHFRTICPDLPGCGRTRSDDGEATTARLADALLAFADTLKLDRVHWVGHSYGSVVLQHLTAKAPGRVQSLALLGPFHAPADATRKALADRAAKARAEGLVEIANATVQMGTSAETKAHRPEVAAFVRELVMRQDANGYASICDAIAGTAPAPVETIACPTLVVTGDEDATAPPPVAKALADKIPGAAFHVLPRCGHWTPLERPREVAALLMNFLLAA